MLKELKIENLAIIEKLDLEFTKGLISLTGETGAGKSIIMSGINLLIGEKAGLDKIRDGSDFLRAQGVFEITDEQASDLVSQGFEIEGNEIIIRRDFERDGKGKAFINGMRVPITNLKTIMESLVDVVGQHSHQMLLSKSNHIKLLDKFLGDEGKSIKSNLKSFYEQHREVTRKIDEIEEAKKEVMAKKDFYEFQLAEINAIKLEAGEDEKLEDEYKILFNASKIKEKLDGAEGLLKDKEQNALSFISNSRKLIEPLCKYGKEFDEVLESLEKVYYDLQDSVDILSTINSGIEADEAKLEKVIKRIDEINKLKLKYGSTIEEIIEYRDKISRQLDMLDSGNFELKDLLEEKEESRKKYYEEATKLSESRKKRASEIEKRLKEELAFLNMKDTEFKVVFEELENMSPSGIDSAEFFISTNLGQELKPLSRIASGGEVSRIMLALKVIFSKVDNISMILFDEIDSGVGGETVKKIAEKLREIGEGAQIICITHSPAIAAKSMQQFYIEKQTVDGKTFSSVTPLSEEARVKEIARMLAGKDVSLAVIEHAKELLNVR
ncbi:MAG: DNA repair protein RecN [Fusobacteriaceae bacterium]